jgi:hypothetical protein
VRHSLVVVIAGALLLLAPPACAQDPFEIQVYRADVNEPHHFGLELHSNYVARGGTTSDAPELPAYHVLHETLEPSFGLTRWWELGAYVQSAVRPDGRIDFGGVKLRTKFRYPRADDAALQFGINLEVSYIPAAYDAAMWGSEIRPIVAWTPGRFLLAVNPILSFEWTGPNTGIPHFEPAAMITYAFGDVLSLGLEYYGALGPLQNVPPLAQQQHYLFEVFNVLAFRGWEIQFGIGEGLTPASNAIVFKRILGREF